jgi:hypothetical protein
MYSNFSGKTWFSASGEDSAGATNYIGVTPLKTYRITVDYGSEIDGTARLIVRNQYGQKVKDSIHKNRACALAAWRRMCD